MHNSIYYILPLIMLSCAPKKPDPKNDAHDGSAPVVILNDEYISLNEFNRRIESLPEFAANRLSSVEAKRAHIRGVAQFEVLALHAAKNGFAKDPEVVSAVKLALQKSYHQKRFELTTAEIDEEMKRRQTEIRFGLILKNADCLLETELAALDGTQRLDAMKVHAGLISFSTRVKETITSSEKMVIERLQKIGDFEITKDESKRCVVIMLTKLESIEIDRVKVETDLRLQKKAAFLDTLEK